MASALRSYAECVIRDDARGRELFRPTRVTPMVDSVRFNGLLVRVNLQAIKNARFPEIGANRIGIIVSSQRMKTQADSGA